MIEVVGTEDFEQWYLDLGEDDTVAVDRAVNRLEQAGVTLGYPHSSEVVSSKFAMRELRAQSQGHPLRIFYLFDVRRQAVLLIGGDKTGDKRFYETMVPRAEKISVEYCRSVDRP